MNYTYYLRSQLAMMSTQQACEICAVIFLVALCFPFETWIEPNHRLFRLDNPSIQFPYTENEQVPPLLLFGLVFVLPLALITTVVTLSRRHRKIAYASILGFLTAFFLNLLATDLLKFWIGNQRPDFLARCLPAPGTDTNRYVGIEVCTATDSARLQDGFRSTPSGHSSTSFCGLMYLSLWIGVHLGTWESTAPLYTALAGLSPLLLAAYVATSRIIDYRHNWYDVAFGSLMGGIIAYFTHKRMCPAPKQPEREELEV